MKIVMGASPRNVDVKPNWTVTMIRAFGIIQVIAIIIVSFVFLRPALELSVFSGMSDTGVILSCVLSILVGLIVGLVSSAMTFALAMLIDDMHAVRGYLQDMQLTGKYYDE